MDGAHRQHPVVQARQLRQCGPRVEGARVVGGDDLDAPVVDGEAVALGRERGVEAHDGLASRDTPVVERARPGSGQQVHRNFFR